MLYIIDVPKVAGIEPSIKGKIKFRVDSSDGKTVVKKGDNVRWEHDTYMVEAEVINTKKVSQCYSEVTAIIVSIQDMRDGKFVLTTAAIRAESN